ncbi:hypothetical protein [Streptomyces olivaceus]|uniref:hypothetical protein n=1 Tax=Streptomyces olivaceus TaxID=47716 RepID=UPI001CCE5615|nr:hypothetical protein [Streptomyces olivaceus]MBZ6232029.1 hypothetical protein [Streptomyces olivaceus]
MTAVGDYTLADLFTLPDLPCRADLIDGHLYLPRPQNRFHSITGDLLLNGLRRTLPPVFRVRRNMTVVLDRRNGLEPCAHTPTGIHHDRLRISVPYDIDIDLTAIDNR